MHLGEFMMWCVRYAYCLLTISVLQMETLKFNFSEKSCACVNELLVSFVTIFCLFKIICSIT